MNVLKLYAGIIIGFDVNFKFNIKMLLHILGAAIVKCLMLQQND